MEQSTGQNNESQYPSGKVESARKQANPPQERRESVQLRPGGGSGAAGERASHPWLSRNQSSEFLFEQAASQNTTPASRQFGREDLLRAHPDLNQIIKSRSKINSDHQRTPNQHQKQFKPSGKRQRSKMVFLNDNMMVDDVQEQIVRDGRPSRERASPHLEATLHQQPVTSVYEERSNDSSSSSSSSSQHSGMVNQYEDLLSGNLQRRITQRYNSVINQIQKKSQSHSKASALNTLQGDRMELLEAPGRASQAQRSHLGQRRMEPIIREVELNSQLDLSRRGCAFKQQRQRTQTKSFMDIVGKQKNKTPIAGKSTVSERAVAQSSAVSTEHFNPADILRNSQTFEGDDLEDVERRVLDGAQELFTKLLGNKYHENTRLNKTQILQIAIKGPTAEKSPDDDDDLDVPHHNQLVTELIDNIFEGTQDNYQMSRHEFMKRLIEQIRTDQYFQMEEQAEDPRASGLRAEAPLPIEQAKESEFREEHDQNEECNEEVLKTDLDQFEKKDVAIDVVHQTQDAIDKIRKRQQKRINSSVYSNTAGKRPVEILNRNRKRFTVQCQNANAKAGAADQVQTLSIDDIKALKMFQYDDSHQFDEAEQIKRQKLESKLKLTNEIEKYMIEMQELLEQAKKDAVLEQHQEAGDPAADPTDAPASKLDYTTLRFNEVLIVFYYHIEKMEEELEQSHANVEILKEEIKFLEEHQNELRDMNQQEAQKNVLSEQFNEKLMNDYEALNLEMLGAKKDNQLLVAESSRMNEQIKSMEQRIEELVDQMQDQNHNLKARTEDRPSGPEEGGLPQSRSDTETETVPKLKQQLKQVQYEKMQVQNNLERHLLQINQMKDYNNDLLAQIFEMKPYYEEYFKDYEIKENKIKSLEEEIKMLREKVNNNSSGVKQYSQQNFHSGVSKGPNKGIESTNSLMDLEQQNEYQIASRSGQPHNGKLAKASLIHVQDEMSSKPPLHCLKQLSGVEKSRSSNYCGKLAGTHDQEKLEDDEILEFSLIDKSSTNEEKSKKEQNCLRDIPINIRLDLAEQQQEKSRRAKSARMGRRFQQAISILEGLSQNKSTDLNQILEQRNKQIQSTFNVLQGSEFSNLFSDIMPQLKPENQQTHKISSYEEFSFSLIHQQDLMLKLISQLSKEIARLHAHYNGELAKLQRARREPPESKKQKHCEKCQRDLLREQRNQRKEQLTKPAPAKEPARITKASLERKKAPQPIAEKEIPREHPRPTAQPDSSNKKVTPKRPKINNPIEQFEQLRAKNLLRYQLLCANRGETKFEELVRKHKNIQQMYGVVGHKLYDAGGSLLEYPSIDEMLAMHGKVATGSYRPCGDPIQKRADRFELAAVDTDQAPPVGLFLDDLGGHVSSNRETGGAKEPAKASTMRYMANEPTRAAELAQNEPDRRASDVFSKDCQVLEDNEEVHNKPSSRRKTQHELDYQLKKILEKKHNYNMICEPSSNLNIDGGLRLQQTFASVKYLTEQFQARKKDSFASQANANELIGVPDPSEPGARGSSSDILALLGQPMGIYTERLHIYKKNKLKECLLIATRRELFICKVDGSKFIVEPFDFKNRIETIIKCIKNNKRETYQAIAIELRRPSTLFEQRFFKRSHIILVHGRRENFFKLIDFLNYQIYASGESHDAIFITKKSQYEHFEITEKTRRSQFQFQDIGFYRVENDERKLNMMRRQIELNDVLFKRINGIVSNHWVNCFIELMQPSAYAHSILKKMEASSDPKAVEDALEQFLTFNFGVNYKADYFKKENEEDKASFVDQVMLKFTYSLLLKVGAANISQSRVSERIGLNRTMHIQVEDSDLRGQAHADGGPVLAGSKESSINAARPAEHGFSNMTVGSLNAASSAFSCENKVKFTLTIDDQVHQFAAVDRNLDTYEKWCGQLKYVESTLKSAPHCERTLAKLRAVVVDMLAREAKTPRASLCHDQQDRPSTHWRMPPKQIFEYNQRIMELQDKYKTQTKMSKQSSFQKRNEQQASGAADAQGTGRPGQGSAGDGKYSPISNFQKYAQHTSTRRLISPPKTSQLRSMPQVNQTVVKEKGWNPANRGSLSNLPRSLTHYSDAMSYFKDRKGSQRLIQLPGSEKHSEFRIPPASQGGHDLPRLTQHEASHEQLLRGDPGIQSPISTSGGNSDDKPAGKRTSTVRRGNLLKSKHTNSTSPVKKLTSRDRSMTLVAHTTDARPKPAFRP